MKKTTSTKFTALRLAAGALLSILLVSCGSYSGSSYNDGIYGTNDDFAYEREMESQVQTYEQNSSNYYENLFANELAMTGAASNDSIFTDVESYSSDNYDEYNNGEVAYRGESAWGSNPSQVEINYVNTGFGFGSFYNPFGYGFGGINGFGGRFGLFYGDPWIGYATGVGIGFPGSIWTYNYLANFYGGYPGFGWGWNGPWGPGYYGNAFANNSYYNMYARNFGGRYSNFNGYRGYATYADYFVARGVSDVRPTGRATTTTSRGRFSNTNGRATSTSRSATSRRTSSTPSRTTRSNYPNTSNSGRAIMPSRSSSNTRGSGSMPSSSSRSSSSSSSRSSGSSSSSGRSSGGSSRSSGGRSSSGRG